MLPKSKRLTSKDFKQLRRTLFAHTPHLRIRQFRVREGEEKAAIVVPASSYKRAVDRNLLRRRLYHIIEANVAALRGRTVIVMVKKGALDLAFRELEREFFASIPK